jgi:hypothetical protein
MEVMKWNYALRLLLQCPDPAGTKRAQPISAFRPEGEDRGFNPPVHRRGPAGRFWPASGDLSDKVVPGRNSGPRETHGCQ